MKVENTEHIAALKSWIESNAAIIAAHDVESIVKRLDDNKAEEKKLEDEKSRATDALFEKIKALEAEIAKIQAPFDVKIRENGEKYDEITKEKYLVEKAFTMKAYHEKALQVLELQEKGYVIIECQASFGYKGTYKVGQVVTGTNFQSKISILNKELFMTRSGIYVINSNAKAPRKIASLDGRGETGRVFRWQKVVLVPGPLVTKPIKVQVRRSYDEQEGFEVIYNPATAITIQS